ncbi:MAG: hypothetical protein ND895_06965, partial [Pyrinomonadaceae bacterium]|nr:hypothetical protein [Pyrinomonadaceae bacterium]
ISPPVGETATLYTQSFQTGRLWKSIELLCLRESGERDWWATRSASAAQRAEFPGRSIFNTEKFATGRRTRTIGISECRRVTLPV